MFQLVTPWRRRIEFDHLRMMQQDNLCEKNKVPRLHGLEPVCFVFLDEDVLSPGWIEGQCGRIASSNCCTVKSASPERSSLSMERCLKSNKKESWVGNNTTICAVHDHSPLAHCRTSPCMFVSPPNSVVVSLKHSPASVTRPIVLRRSQIAQ